MRVCMWAEACGVCRCWWAPGVLLGRQVSELADTAGPWAGRSVSPILLVTPQLLGSSQTLDPAGPFPLLLAPDILTQSGQLFSLQWVRPLSSGGKRPPHYDHPHSSLQEGPEAERAQCRLGWEIPRLESTAPQPERASQHWPGPSSRLPEGQACVVELGSA